MTSKEEVIQAIKDKYKHCLDSNEEKCAICFSAFCDISEEDVTNRPFSQRFNNSSGYHPQVILNCGHKFHKTCLDEWGKRSARIEGFGTCPSCRTPITDADPFRDCNCDDIVKQLNDANRSGGKNKRNKKLKTKKQKKIKHKKKTFRKKCKN